MTEKILIREFMKDKKVGAVFSTGRHVINKMLKNIDFDKADILVEYGPGKGVITTHILERMRKDAVLFVFETNELFIKELLNINDKRLVIINADAEKVQPILKNRYKINKVDYIISTIPFTFLGRRKRRRIISKTYNLLNEKGKFITYQYTGLIHQLIKQIFRQTRVIVSVLNIPPAIIFIGIK
jgi:phospholipid N-methyltransferase